MILIIHKGHYKIAIESKSMFKFKIVLIRLGIVQDYAFHLDLVNMFNEPVRI